MKKKKRRHHGPGGATRSQVALSAAIAALPFTVPSLQAQVSDTTASPVPDSRGARRVSPSLSRDLCCLKFADRYDKEASRYTIVGTDKQHTIYRNARNEYFYLDPATGDMKFVAPDAYIKIGEQITRSPARATSKTLNPIASKQAGEVSILGVDQAGHVVHQNARGETFYLDPNTGDMVFSK
jgi:hypothetical protein